VSADLEVPAAPAPSQSPQGGGRSFFIRYLGRELGRRARQAIVIALGLALGIGLVIVVSAAATGVKNAQASVLHSLYGVGTDITVTQSPGTGSGVSKAGNFSLQIQGGPGQKAKVCVNGKCKSGAQTIDQLFPQGEGVLSYSEIAKIERLADVKAAAGGLTLSDTNISISSTSASPPTNFTVQGVDLSHDNLGPLSSASLASGRAFTTSDANSDVALVDADYAKASNLKVGSDVTIAKRKFKVIGIVNQAEGSSPPDVYIPLARAQALGTRGPGGGGSLKGYVDTIYVTAASTADISAVQKEIKALLPKATVTTSSSLASEINGSLGSAAKLAGDLGTWLSILVLVAAFAVAGLLTMSAVSRRAREFGTLKAIGWRSRRIIGQVMGESVATGLIGGAAGIGLGFAGAAIVDKIAPKLTATIPTSTGTKFASHVGAGSVGGGPVSVGPGGALGPTTQSIPVHWSASVTLAVIGLAVLLAVVGGLLAGGLGSWRISQLRPADALARVD
jgi:putative ABC transport system permease protein